MQDGRVAEILDHRLKNLRDSCASTIQQFCAEIGDQQYSMILEVYLRSLESELNTFQELRQELKLLGDKLTEQGHIYITCLEEEYGDPWMLMLPDEDYHKEHIEYIEWLRVQPPQAVWLGNHRLWLMEHIRLLSKYYSCLQLMLSKELEEYVSTHSSYGSLLNWNEPRHRTKLNELTERYPAGKIWAAKKGFECELNKLNELRVPTLTLPASKKRRNIIDFITYAELWST